MLIVSCAVRFKICLVIRLLNFFVTYVPSHCEQLGPTQRLEFLAALELMPPSINSEVSKLQSNLRQYFGNWWERLHSQVSVHCLLLAVELTVIIGNYVP